MKLVFADTAYWIATLMPGDDLRDKAMTVSRALGNTKIVTSEMVLVEVLNGLSDCGAQTRLAAVKTVKIQRSDSNVIIVPQTKQLFESAFKLYGKFKDKEWSITDCSSFVIMKEKHIKDALTKD